MLRCGVVATAVVAVGVAVPLDTVSSRTARRVAISEAAARSLAFSPCRDSTAASNAVGQCACAAACASSRALSLDAYSAITLSHRQSPPFEPLISAAAALRPNN